MDRVKLIGIESYVRSAISFLGERLETDPKILFDYIRSIFSTGAFFLGDMNFADGKEKYLTIDEQLMCGGIVCQVLRRLNFPVTRNICAQLVELTSRISKKENITSSAQEMLMRVLRELDDQLEIRFGV